MGSSAAGEPVGDESPGKAAFILEELAERAFRGPAVPSTLHQDVDRVAALVHRPPQAVPFPSDCDEELVQMPSIARMSLFSSQGSSVTWSALRAPEANLLVGRRFHVGPEDPPCLES